MNKLTGLGLTLSPYLFIEMMKLYMATCQYEKVPLVVMQMTRNKIPKYALSYNLWMDACAKASGVAAAEAVYREMLSDENAKVGWSTLSTLANIYVKAGLVEKAAAALKNAEAKLSTNNRFGYIFLMTQYTSLNSKDDVMRLWEASKAVGKRLSCANYMCILSCLVKLGDLVQAERVFMEWESNCQKYDVRVSNVLLGAYMRNGWVEKAESLYIRSLKKGGCPNYKTWEILMEGWVRSHKMVKAINAMKEGFAMLKDCRWRPSQGILVAIAEYFEKQGKLEDANNFIRDIQAMGLASSPIYKSLLRIHVSAKRPANDILEMMDKDKIEMDDEISTLVQASEIDSRNYS
ncbi:pentatricopeptide repeat-containing protein At5g27460 [Herrania umbratica]|uniref:Pentatricopeptide repeat-containing protein At5g27460 n=1 Tax=Herrania umbratica TaxID=108875 RepID=A0A6J1ACC0_9ROSI|nr:pentatricopeptide repeat-containing protein At5g27460 [Herrania umbratica]